METFIRSFIAWRLGGQGQPPPPTWPQSGEEEHAEDAERVETAWETDRRGQNYYQSPSWYEFIGSPPGSSYGEDWLQFYHPDDRDLLLREWHRALEGKGSYVYDIRVRIRRHDGVYRTFRVAGAPVLDAQGEVLKWKGTCVAVDAAPQPRHPLRVLYEPKPSRRVLVVDDNRDSADTIVALLQTMGHAAVAEYDGPGALRAARRHRPEFVFLDLVLPGMSGFDVARRLRQELGTAVRIIAMSGFGHDRQSEAEGPIDQHLITPVDPGFLASLLGGKGSWLG